MLLLHEAAEDDQANMAVQEMPGFEQNAQLLAAIELPPGHLLTAEQVKFLFSVTEPCTFRTLYGCMVFPMPVPCYIQAQQRAHLLQYIVCTCFLHLLC